MPLYGVCCYGQRIGYKTITLQFCSYLYGQGNPKFWTGSLQRRLPLKCRESLIIKTSYEEPLGHERSYLNEILLPFLWKWLGDRKHTTRWIKIISHHNPLKILYLSFGKKICFASRSLVFKWHRRFLDRKDNLEYDLFINISKIAAV